MRLQGLTIYVPEEPLRVTLFRRMEIIGGPVASQVVLSEPANLLIFSVSFFYFSRKF